MTMMINTMIVMRILSFFLSFFFPSFFFSFSASHLYSFPMNSSFSIFVHNTCMLFHFSFFFLSFLFSSLPLRFSFRRHPTFGSSPERPKISWIGRPMSALFTKRVPDLEYSQRRASHQTLCFRYASPLTKLLTIGSSGAWQC